MPDRMIRDQCRRSPTLRDLSDAAERAWWRLTVACDDHGRFDADPEVLLAQLFTRRPEGWTLAKMLRAIEEWDAAGLIHRYAGVDGRAYGHVVTFLHHQRARDSRSRYPEPPCGNLPQNAAACGESRQTAALSGSGLRPPAVIRRDSSSARAREAGEGQDQNGAGPPGVVFSIPASITAALGKAPTLGAVPMLARPDWWQRQVRAHPGVDFARELLRAEAWIAANPARAPRKDLAGFLWRWFSKAERDGAGA